jgi:hypothetical protein
MDPPISTCEGGTVTLPPVAAEASVFAAPASAASDAGKQTAGGRQYHHVPLSTFSLYGAYWYCVLLCEGAVLVSSRPAVRVDSAGKPACELCGRRLADTKGKLHAHGPGHICQRCYNRTRSSVAMDTTTPLPATPKPSRKRRAQSDPGERTAPRRAPVLTRRVSATGARSSTYRRSIYLLGPMMMCP